MTNKHEEVFIKETDTEIVLRAECNYDELTFMKTVFEYFKQLEQAGTKCEIFTDIIRDLDLVSLKTQFKTEARSRSIYDICRKYENLMSNTKYSTDKKWIDLVKKNNNCGLYIEKIPKYVPYIILRHNEDMSEYVMYLDIKNCLNLEKKKELENMVGI